MCCVIPGELGRVLSEVVVRGVVQKSRPSCVESELRIGQVPIYFDWLKDGSTGHGRFRKSRDSFVCLLARRRRCFLGSGCLSTRQMVSCHGEFGRSYCYRTVLRLGCQPRPLFFYNDGSIKSAPVENEGWVCTRDMCNWPRSDV